MGLIFAAHPVFFFFLFILKNGIKVTKHGLSSSLNFFFFFFFWFRFSVGLLVSSVCSCCAAQKKGQMYFF